MISSTHPVIHWYWPSEAEFFAELALELESESLPSELKEEIRIKLARYFSGLARKRKDYKDLVGFRKHSMFELRISFSNYAEERNLRLILSSQSAGIYVLK
jgi:hypothetical protein